MPKRPPTTDTSGRPAPGGPTPASAAEAGNASPHRFESADDPRVVLEREIGGELFEPIPPFPTKTERESEFYSLADGQMFINIGPQHPATHGVLRLVLKLSGEQIVDVDPVIGYLHRGVEKICENSDYYHIIDQVDPLEYLSSLFQEWPAVMAVEKLMDVQVPRRAEYIRVLTGELLRIGGVNGDLNHEFMSRLGDWMSRAGKQADAITGLLNENEIFVRRMRDIGTMDRAKALSYGVTGANIRACGVPFDLRRAHPYSIYPELEFNVPTREEGDSLARYLMRVDEIKESIRIIDQCLENMPDGPIMAKMPRLLRPRPGRAWAAVEAPRGMLGVYAISDGSDQPFRFRIHDPSFMNLSVVPSMLPGNLLADTMAIVSSLDPVMGGVDR